MPFLSESDLVKSIRARTVFPCYMLWGRDAAVVELVAKKLSDRLVPENARDFNLHFMAGAEFSSRELAGWCESLPVFSDRVVIMVNDLNAESLRADELKQLEKTISGIDPETTSVIFYATGIDLAQGKKQLSPKNKKLADHISKCGGAVTEFGFKRPAELVKHIQTRLGTAGCYISPDAAQHLAQLCGCSRLVMNNECDKLAAYAVSGEITVNMINELVSGQTETDAYKLSRAILSGRRSETFELLDALYSKQAEAIPLLSVIAGSVMDLYRAKAAILSGKSAQDVISDFSYKGRSFAVENAFRDCRGMSMEKIRRFISVLSDCDIDMKSKRTDPRVLLETAIAKMLSEKPGGM